METLKEIWEKSTIREETEDHWGRMGRGVDINYLNPKLKDKKYISELEYNSKILKFKNILINSLYTNDEIEKELSIELVENMTIHNDLFLNLIQDYNKIFGGIK